MDRKDFFKNICKYGACGCAGMMMLSPVNVIAQEDTPEKKEEDWRIGFMQNRMASFIGDMEGELDDKTMKLLLEKMGRFCAKENFKKNKKYIGDIDGYLETTKEWTEKTEHDKQKGIITIVGKKMENCFCPFVDKSKMPKDFCNCTLGWSKEIYETIIGKPVDVKISTSILRGNDRCSFTITYMV